MHKLTTLALLLLLVTAAIEAPAAPFTWGDAGPMLAANKSPAREAGKDRRNMLQKGPRVGSRQATDRVKKRYSDRRILSVNLVQGKGSPMYRVKTLSGEGVVKYVYVDGNSGSVFE